MKLLLLLAMALISSNSIATTFIVCLGNSKTESKLSDGKINTTTKDVRFQIEFDNFEGNGTAKLSGDLSSSNLKNCTFTNDLIECNDAFYISSKIGELTKLGLTQKTTGSYKHETKLKVNRKTGLGEFTAVQDSETTEPVEKAGSFSTYENAKFLCKPATKNQF